MSWYLSPSFTAACERSDQSMMYYSASKPPRLSEFVANVRDRRRRYRPRCPGGDPGPAARLDADVSALLRRRGLPPESTGGPPPMLWCLGGPDLYRPFEGDDLGNDIDYQSDSCVDLNVYVCGTHRLVACDLWPFDLAEWNAGQGPATPGRPESALLADEWEEACERFLVLLDEMLSDVLVT